MEISVFFKILALAIAISFGIRFACESIINLIHIASGEMPKIKRNKQDRHLYDKLGSFRNDIYGIL